MHNLIQIWTTPEKDEVLKILERAEIPKHSEQNQWFIEW